jgi:hypothetical protein
MDWRGCGWKWPCPSWSYYRDVGVEGLRAAMKNSTESDWCLGIVTNFIATLTHVFAFVFFVKDTF